MIDCNKNNLNSDPSPYLQQHKNNPVNWQVWSKEIFKIAKEKKMPILLSVGYASCHWCHVMAHESFEDQETANLMNNYFINIKVDREERPDIDFVYQNSYQIFNQAAKVRYMFGGKADMPMVLRASYGAGASSASQHSQALYPIFTHIPGLKVVVPSNPYDAKGLLINAIRDEDPVIFLEHKMLYDISAEVPDEAYTVPFGEAGIIREGKDVTLISLGKMVNVCLVTTNTWLA